MALSPEQQKALALAAARQRASGAGEAQQPKGDAYDAFMQEAKKVHDQTVAPANNDILGVLGALNDFSHAATTGAMQGLTFGFGDELTAGVETPFRVIGDLATGRGFDPGRAFGEALTGAQEYMNAEQARNPVGAAVGDVVGAVANPINKLGFLNGAASVPGAIVRGAADGAIFGGISGFGRADGDLTDRAVEAATGATVGAGAGGLLGGAVGALAGRAAKAKVPTVAEMEDQAGAIYDAAEKSGVVFAKPAVRAFADDITATAITEGIDQTIHPAATAALKRIQSLRNNGATVKDLRTLRKVLRAAGKDNTNGDQQRIAGIMTRALDDFIDTQVPSLKPANRIYQQAKKGEVIETAIELAHSKSGGTRTGLENAIRNEFQALDRQIIKGQLKGLTKAEISAIRHAARGGKVENILRYVGKLAPTGVVSGSASLGVPFAIGNVMGGPIVGATAAGATAGTGLLSKTLATQMAIANAERAALTARNGGAALAPKVKPAVGALVDAAGNETGNLTNNGPIEITIGTRGLPVMSAR